MATPRKMGHNRLQIARNLCLFIALLTSGILLLVNISSPSGAVPMKIINQKHVTVSADEQHVLVYYEEAENFRRQVAEDIHTAQFFLRTRLKELSSSVDSHQAVNVDSLLAEAEDRLRVIEHKLASFERLLELPAWRKEKAASLSREVQRRIDTLQNPSDCASAKKIVCEMSRSAGAGSLIHHLVYCIMAAYGTGKTFVLQSKGWRYSPKGWEAFFQPLSRTCVEAVSGTIEPWPGTNQSESVMFPKWDKPKPKPFHQPLAVPQDIASSLTSFHERPSAWWVGQFIAYLMRLRPEMQLLINQVKQQLNFGSPIVGVHVRRTDKKSEARLYPLEEYMVHVENYYLGLDITSPSGLPIPRRVFLASDLASLITEARAKYPKYEFLWHNNTAEKVKTRYSASAFKDFLVELHLLAHSDYLVCTFSSNVCRLAYEIMQSLRVDASSRVVSLDTNHFFHQMRPRHLSVRFPHHPEKYGKNKGFMDAEVGQVLKASTRNVFGTGYVLIDVPSKKKVTQKYMPDYKVQEILDIVNVTLPDHVVQGKPTKN